MPNVINIDQIIDADHVDSFDFRTPGGHSLGDTPKPCDADLDGSMVVFLQLRFNAKHN